MKLQLKTAPWLCMATSFAMALDIPLAELLEAIGDGGEVVFPSQPEPRCRKGHHVQEIIPYCVQLGYSVTPIELYPISKPLHGSDSEYHRHGRSNEREEFFEYVLASSHGVLDGWGRTCGHAVAYDLGQIYDPDGRQFPYSLPNCQHRNFIPRCAWRIDRIAVTTRTPE